MAHDDDSKQKQLLDKIDQLEAKIAEFENTESNSSAWLNNSPVCTKIVDLDFNLQYMSNAGINALQIDDVSAYYGKPYPLYFFPDAYKSEMSQNLLKAKETGETIIQDGEILDIKGNPLWFQATITPVYNKQGKIDHILVVSIDTSASKQAKDDLLKSEKKYRELVNLAQEGIWVIDKNNDTSFVNPSMANMLGYSADEMVGKSLFNFMDDTGVKIANENLNRRQAGIKDQHDFEFICKNGNRILTSIIAAPIMDDAGNYNGAIAGVMNITERKQAEEKEKIHHRNIDSLSKTAMQFVEFPHDSNIYDFVGERVKEFTGKNSYVVVNSIDPKTGFSTIQSVLGAGKLAKFISNNLGEHPVGMKIEGEDLNIHYQDGKLHVYKEGLYGLLFKTVSKTICSSIEKLAGVNKIYVIDLANKEQFFGNVIIFLKDKKAKIKNKSLIETFIKQASIAILKRQAEEELRNAHARHSSMIENIGDVIAILGVDGIIKYQSPNIEKWFGWTQKDMINSNSLDYLHPEDIERIQKEYSNILEKDNGSKKLEFRHRCKDGNYSWIELTAANRINDPNISGILVNYHDITERKQSEEKLKESEEKFRALYDNAPLSYQSLNEDGSFNDVNPTWLSTLGYKRDEIIGRYYKDFVHPDWQAHFEYSFPAFIKRGYVNDVQYKIRHKAGHYLDISFEGYIGHHPDGSFKQTYCVFQNITERKQAEDNVRRLSTAVEQSPSVVVITDKQGVLEYVNPKFTELTGYSSSEAIGQKSNILKSGEQDAAFYKEMWETVDSGKIWRGQFHNKKKNGELFWEAASISAILNQSGDVINFIKIGEDITQQKINEEDLKLAFEKALESDRLKSAFLANMSHEIRTPMNGILGFAELLENPNLTGEKQQQYISIIKKGGARMLNIINDIVSISMIESGQIKVNNQESDIIEQLQYIYTFFKPQVEEKGMEFIFSKPLSYEKLILITDREKVFAILTNLVKNAIKYSESGYIELGHNIKDNFIEIYVKDTGIGVSADKQEAIFERFIQADIEDSMARQGAGLGLSISKAYAEILGGKIWMESGGENLSTEECGSTFYFTLPYNPKTKVENDSEKEISDSVEITSTNELKILIVEDDETSEELISIIIQDLAKEIIIARTGKEAVNAFHNNPNIDLILMDIQLPGISGFEVTRQIRKSDKDVIIIAQTAYGLLGDREKVIAAGCDDYISKPINKDELLKLITKYIKK